MPNFAQYFPVSELPAADSTQHGRSVLYTRPGYIDVAYVCRKKADDTYEWYTVVDTDPFATGGSGAPVDAPYLTTVAVVGLSAEIPVGTAPGGELGGTWASPTVDTTHSGSAHHAAFVQADHDALPNPHHSNANDHARQHSATSVADHTFPGGTTNFMRADGTFAAPPGGSAAAVYHLDFSTEEVALVG